MSRTRSRLGALGVLRSLVLQRRTVSLSLLSLAFADLTLHRNLTNYPRDRHRSVHRRQRLSRLILPPCRPRRRRPRAKTRSILGRRRGRRPPRLHRSSWCPPTIDIKNANAQDLDPEHTSPSTQAHRGLARPPGNGGTRVLRAHFDSVAMLRCLHLPSLSQTLALTFPPTTPSQEQHQSKCSPLRQPPLRLRLHGNSARPRRFPSPLALRKMPSLLSLDPLFRSRNDGRPNPYHAGRARMTPIRQRAMVESGTMTTSSSCDQKRSAKPV